MRRSLELDVRACPRCGGHLRLIALIEAPAVSERLLWHLGLPPAIPKVRPHERRRCTSPVEAAPAEVAGDQILLDEPA